MWEERGVRVRHVEAMMIDVVTTGMAFEGGVGIIGIVKLEELVDNDYEQVCLRVEMRVLVRSWVEGEVEAERCRSQSQYRKRRFLREDDWELGGGRLSRALCLRRRLAVIIASGEATRRGIGSTSTTLELQ